MVQGFKMSCKINHYSGEGGREHCITSPKDLLKEHWEDPTTGLKKRYFSLHLFEGGAKLSLSSSLSSCPLFLHPSRFDAPAVWENGAASERSEEYFAGMRTSEGKNLFVVTVCLFPWVCRLSRFTFRCLPVKSGVLLPRTDILSDVTLLLGFSEKVLRSI